MYLKKEMLSPKIDGGFQEKFTHLANTFTDNFIHFNETGAGLCIFSRKKVVDLYGSHHPVNSVWFKKDRVCTMSCGKAPLALCLRLLSEKGLLNFDVPVAQSWPELSQNVKNI